MTITRKFFWGHFLFLRVNTSYQQNSILVKGIRHELLNQRTLSNHILDHLRHILNSLIIHGMHNIHDINDKHYKQAQLGVPHSKTQVGLQSYFNWGQVSVEGTLNLKLKSIKQAGILIYAAIQVVKMVLIQICQIK